MKKITTFILISIISFTVQAQFSKTLDPNATHSSSGSATRNQLMSIECSGFIQPNMDEPDWNFQFRRIEDEGIKDPELLALKNSYPDKHLIDSYRTEDEVAGSSRANIQINAQFDANVFDGSYPPDNSIAVSKDGNIVTAVNSNIRYYTTTGQLKGSKSFTSFVNDNSMTSILFDPKVIYDSGSDRFFLTMLHGFTASTSHILCFFSKTSNPADGWYYYKIKISNSVANRWADYPNIGVSNNEVYVTANLFDNNDFFKESVLFQMTKAPLYAGGTLNFLYWSNIKDDQNQGSFTLMPCSYGLTGNYGPGIVLCGVRSASSGSKIQIYDLTNDLGSNPQINGYSASVSSFQIGSNAVQPGGSSSQDLDIGDCRMKHAFFLNNMIHCAFTASYQSGYNGIYYARINLNPLSATTKKYGQTNVDIGYPAMAPFTNSQTDKTVLFMYEKASTTINPGLEVIVCDDNMNFGTPLSVKNGLTYIDVEPDQSTYERWGDYGAVSRSPATTTPTVWVFGIYARSNNVYGNNVCEITNGAPVSDELLSAQSAETKVYPNPVVNHFNLEIKVQEYETVSIDIFDVNGKLVQHLADKELAANYAYTIGFNTNLLTPGIYFLRITNGKTSIRNEKIIVQ